MEHASALHDNISSRFQDLQEKTSMIHSDTSVKLTALAGKMYYKLNFQNLKIWNQVVVHCCSMARLQDIVVFNCFGLTWDVTSNKNGTAFCIFVRFFAKPIPNQVTVFQKHLPPAPFFIKSFADLINSALVQLNQIHTQKWFFPMSNQIPIDILQVKKYYTNPPQSSKDANPKQTVQMRCLGG